MQRHRFTNGGFCIHKATGHWKGNASAWYDIDGKLLDAEHTPVPFGSSRPVKRGGLMWTALEALGRRWKNVPIQ